MSPSPAFRHVGSTRVESLNLEIQHYEHLATGAVHYHLATDHDENVFLVGTADHAARFHRRGTHSGTHRPVRQRKIPGA